MIRKKEARKQLPSLLLYLSHANSIYPINQIPLHVHAVFRHNIIFLFIAYISTRRPAPCVRTRDIPNFKVKQTTRQSNTAHTCTCTCTVCVKKNYLRLYGVYFQRYGKFFLTHAVHTKHVSCGWVGLDVCVFMHEILVKCDDTLHVILLLLF